MTRSPVFRQPTEDKQVDTTELSKRVQSLHGKIEAIKNDIKSIEGRLSKLDGTKTGKITENA